MGIGEYMRPKTIVLIFGVVVIFSLIITAFVIVSIQQTTTTGGLFGGLSNLLIGRQNVVQSGGYSSWLDILNNMFYLLALIPVMFIAYFEGPKGGIISLVLIEGLTAVIYWRGII